MTMKSWNGGDCPVDDDAIVIVKVNVWKEPIGPAKAFNWKNGARDWWQKYDDGLARIVAYEVLA